jgi:lysophospholipase L1-like esterase
LPTFYNPVNHAKEVGRTIERSPRARPQFAALGRAGLARFERDVLAQAGAKYVIVGLGINDIAFPAFPLTPPSEMSVLRRS